MQGRLGRMPLHACVAPLVLVGMDTDLMFAAAELRATEYTKWHQRLTGRVRSEGHD